VSSADRSDQGNVNINNCIFFGNEGADFKRQCSGNGVNQAC